MYILFYYCLNMLKVFILVIAFLLALATYISHPILAGGDKVGGELGQGIVEQNTNTELPGVCPYDNCPPLTE